MVLFKIEIKIVYTTNEILDKCCKIKKIWLGIGKLFKTSKSNVLWSQKNIIKIKKNVICKNNNCTKKKELHVRHCNNCNQFNHNVQTCQISFLTFEEKNDK